MLMKMIFNLKLLELKFTKNGFNRGLIMKVGVNRTQNAAQDSTPIWLKFHKINRKRLFAWTMKNKSCLQSLNQVQNSHLNIHKFGFLRLFTDKLKVLLLTTKSIIPFIVAPQQAVRDKIRWREIRAWNPTNIVIPFWFPTSIHNYRIDLHQDLDQPMNISKYS